MLSHPAAKRFTVFEAANSNLKEIYVASTSMAIVEAMAAIARELPPPIAHWDPERQHIQFRSLEFDLTREEAEAFIKRCTAMTPTGWKCFVDQPSRAIPRKSRAE